MQFSTEDVEKFIAGAEEIDRKREVISRTLGTMFSIINKHGGQLDHILFVRVELENSGVLIIEAVHSSTRGPSIDVRTFGCSWNPREDGFTVPHKEVPSVYKALPEIISTVAEALETEITEHFNFFIEQAPDA